MLEQDSFEVDTDYEYELRLRLISATALVIIAVVSLTSLVMGAVAWVLTSLEDDPLSVPVAVLVGLGCGIFVSAFTWSLVKGNLAKLRR